MILEPVTALYNTISAVCPIRGVSIGVPATKSTWRIDFDPTATPAQKTAAQTALTNFDYTASKTTYDTAITQFGTDTSTVQGINLVKQLMGSTPAQIDTFLAGVNGIADANTRAIMAVVLKLLSIELRNSYS